MLTIILGSRPPETAHWRVRQRPPVGDMGLHNVPQNPQLSINVAPGARQVTCDGFDDLGDGLWEWDFQVGAVDRNGTYTLDAEAGLLYEKTGTGTKPPSGGAATGKGLGLLGWAALVVVGYLVLKV